MEPQTEKEVPEEKPKKKKSKGLGDSIEKATKMIGIKPCRACRKRRDKLNELFPY